ncbi:ROK family protein [Streptomyces sp. NPDC003247]|uniref:ROK family protein n=1 Tax=Streptomyces sp. NPDC003247 TaxID=3364677 RepID=UPI0036D03A1A
MTVAVPATGGPRAYVVADLGGTTLRIGRISPGADAPESVRRTTTEGLHRYRELPAQELQGMVVEQLGRELEAYLGSPEGAGASAVGVAFAGPMTKDGTVLAGPTLWGGSAEPLPIAGILTRRLGVPVVVANDITAAAWRYASAERDPFCLITVSSGIGHKVFRNGEVLVSDSGHGGEIGHWRVDPGADALPCECGGRGHLGGMASGRGVLLAARRAAEAAPESFRRCALAGPAGGDPARITNEDLARAVRTGDAFATQVLRDCLVPLALAVNCIFTAIGVRRYLFIGGFAVAVGPRFVSLLGEELTKLGCFGLAEEEIPGMLALGAADDDHGLIGMARMLTETLAVGAGTGGGV